MTVLLGMFVVFGAAIAGMEFVTRGTNQASLLVTMSYWTGMTTGPLALAAVAVLARGNWLRHGRRACLSTYPLVGFMAVMWLVMAIRMDIYPWTQEPTIAWLSKNFFLARNFILLLLTFVIGRGLARAVTQNSPKAATYATLYIMVWVITMSMVAFDWVMTLEYPFINTLFGGYFFIMSFLMGIIITAYFAAARVLGGEADKKILLRDTAIMMLAFCFLRAGFMFAQYLPIWYGNIPEEVNYLYKRVSPMPYYWLARLVLALYFVIPFLTLLSRPIKKKPIPVALLGLSILVGLYIEQLMFVVPVVGVNAIVLGVETVLMVVLLIATIRRRNSFMLQEVTVSGGERDATGNLASAANH